MSAAVVEAHAVVRRYGERRVVDGVDLNVEAGELMGLIGPNGAGKTTLVECIEGLRVPDSGEIRVLGLDPRRDRRAVRQRIGIQLQVAQLPDRLRVGEAVELFASFYRRRADGDKLLEEWGLGARRSSAFAELSGGERQRLFVVLALVNEPDLVFLDEITTGLDPDARRMAWAALARVRDEGTAVVLVTHEVGELERLCDRVAIMHAGRIVAVGTPQDLIDDLRPSGDTNEVTLESVYFAHTATDQAVR